MNEIGNAKPGPMTTSSLAEQVGFEFGLADLVFYFYYFYFFGTQLRGMGPQSSDEGSRSRVTTGVITHIRILGN